MIKPPTKSAGMVILHAFETLGSVPGEMSLVLAAIRPTTKRQLRSWVKRLRATADELETLL